METLRGFEFIKDYRYIGVFCIFFLYSTGCASIIPGRSTMIFVGVLCHRGILNPYLTVPVAIIAAIMGANVGYVIGRYTVGSIIAHRERFIFISRAKIERGMEIARQHGAKLIIPAMFVGGFWLLTSIIPGMIRMRYYRFGIVNALGLVAWVIILTCMGYFGGYVWSKALVGKSYIIIPIVGAILALLIIWRIATRKLQH